MKTRAEYIKESTDKAIEHAKQAKIFLDKIKIR